VPAFVLGFLAAITLRTAGAVPASWLDTIHGLQTAALTAALFGIGATTKLADLKRLGPRPLLLGLLAWLLVAGVAYAGTVATGG
jgi:uncharacterized membrane protein YadS